MTADQLIGVINSKADHELRSDTRYDFRGAELATPAGWITLTDADGKEFRIHSANLFRQLEDLAFESKKSNNRDNAVYHYLHFAKYDDSWISRLIRWCAKRRA